MKASYKMRKTIARLEKKYGPFELEFKSCIYQHSPSVFGFYSSCCCHNSSVLGNKYIIVTHNGSFGFLRYSAAQLVKGL